MVTAEQIAKLSNREKIATMQLLWENFSAQGLASDVPDRHKKILDERDKATVGANKYISWEDAKRQIDESCR